MRKHIFTVAEIWTDKPGYTVIISDKNESEIDFKNGDLLDLCRPDGSSLQHRGTAIIFDPPAVRPLAVILQDLTGKDVPIGTEVWLVEAERPVKKLHRKFEVIGRSES